MKDDLVAVFRNRWPEILLIVGFMVIGMYLREQLVTVFFNELMAQDSDKPLLMTETTRFLFSMAAMFFLITSLIFLLGFLATLSVNFLDSHEPTTLLRVGRIFFWRTLRFLLGAELFVLLLSSLIFSPLRFMFYRNVDVSDVPRWVSEICSLIGVGIIAKVMLLMMPIMICRNLMVLPAVKALKGYRIGDIIALPVLFFAGLAVVGLFTFAQEGVTPGTVLYHTLLGVKALLSGLVALLCGMIGIWYVCGNKFGVLSEKQEENADEEDGELDILE